MNPAEKKKGFLIKIILIVLGGIAGIYLGVSAYFHSHFLPSTTLNGLSVSGKSREAAEALITEEIDGYELKLKEREEKEETLKGMDIALKPEFGDSIEQQIKKQNGFAWPAAIFSPQAIEEATMVKFDEEALEELVSNLECMEQKNQVEPKDAYCSDYSNDGYEIIPEEPGSKIEKEQLIKALETAVSNLEESISLEEEDCYVDPKVTSESRELTELVDTLNKYTGVTVTYNIGEKTEVLDGSITNEWMEVDNMQVSINEEAVEEYVSELASSYNTVFRGHTLKTSYGTTINIPNGDYGWKVDKEGEKEQILNDLKAGESVEREITYAQTANSHGENDYGDTYVEINLTAQHLFFYKNGSLVVESDFVSGNLSKNYDTPTGVYGLTYKERDATLKGENYASDVSYWMPFCNNVGMHDATWRSSFGGSIYKTSGSHGCINLPSGAAKKIFENIEQGDPVLVYTLPGSESAAVVAQDAAQVVNMINSIGEVSLASEPTIVMARKLYNLLSPAGQAQVPNYDILAASEAQLAALKAQAASEAPVQ